MPVVDGQKFVANGVKVTCFHTPCHTRGHMLYLLEVDSNVSYVIEKDLGGRQVTRNVKQALFSGDTIFIGGCGKFFEG
jgi:hydroxyacylglutathione hydrolase